MAKQRKSANSHPAIKYETKDEAMAAIRQKALNLEFCSEEMKKDFNVVSTAVMAFPASIKFAAPEMRSNFDIAMIAVKKDPNMLRYVRIEDMSYKEAFATVKAAVTKNPNTIVYAGDFGHEPEVAILAVQTIPSTATIDMLSSETCQNLKFLEGVGDIARKYNDESLINYAVKRAIREANGDSRHLEDLRLAIAHFEYNKTIGIGSYNYLKRELIGAQDKNSPITPPFEPGEYTREDDALWEGQKEAPYIVAAQMEAERDRTYGELIATIYTEHQRNGCDEYEASERTFADLTNKYFPEDPEFKKWYFANSSFNSKDDSKQRDQEEYMERDVIPSYGEEGHGSAPVQDPPEELSDEEIMAQYFDDNQDSDHGIDLSEYMDDEIEADPKEKEDNSQDIEHKENDGPGPGADSKNSQKTKRESYRNLYVYPAPSAEMWATNDNMRITQEDFKWWDQYRNPNDGAVDFDLIPDLSEVSFAHAKALILRNPEYIRNFPEVPYLQDKATIDNTCYGRNDERLFNAIIDKHYQWAKEYNEKKKAVETKKAAIATASDPAKFAALKKELKNLNDELNDIMNNKPANMEKDSMLIQYAGQAITERDTETPGDGGRECITKKYTVVNPKTFEYLSPRAREDKEISGPVIEAEPTMLKFADSKTVNNPDIIFRAYEKDPSILRYAGKSFFIGHMDFVKDIIKEDPSSVAMFARGQLLNDKEFALFAVQQNGLAIQYFNSSIRHDRAIVEEAMKNTNGESLHRAGNEYVNNPSWAKKAVGIIPASLRFFKYAIKGMVDVVKYAVTKDPSSIRYASEQVRNNKEMALELVKEDGMVLADLGANRRGDYDVVLEAVKQNGEALQFATPDLRNEIEIAFAAVKQNGLTIQFAGEQARNTSVVALAALRENIEALGFIGKELAEDDAFIAKATIIINDAKRREYEEKGTEFTPYTKDEAQKAVGTGKLPEDKSTFLSRMGEGLTEVFVKPGAKHFPGAENILKKAGQKTTPRKTRTMTFDVESAIRRGREEEAKRKEEKAAREAERQQGTSKENTQEKVPKRNDLNIDK